MLAARCGHIDAVMALIEAGADVNLQNKASSFVLFISVCIVAPFGLFH